MYKKEIIDIEMELIVALEANDFLRLAEVAHKAKSNVSILGMSKQAEDMKMLEADIIENRFPESYENRIYTFISECKSALSEIVEIEQTF